MNATRFIVAVGCTVCLAAAASAPAQVGYVERTHDPCIARAGDAYWIFTTGRGLPMRRSADLVTWERAGSALDDLPEWAKRDIPGARGMWAPDVAFFNGRYHLYYSVSTFGSRRSCIGLATNDALDPADPKYKWIDRGKVIETFADSDWNAIDANVVLDEQGTPWMSLGSFWGGIKMVRLDAATGLRSKDDDALHSIARRPRPGAIEAPFIVRRNGFYYQFVSFDFCCRGAKSTYNIRVGRSKSVTGPYVDRAGVSMMEGGGTLLLEGAGDVRGPGHNAVLQDPDRGDFLVHHYYDATDNGRSKLHVRPMTWDEEGWPVAGNPLAAPAAAATAPSTGPTTTAPSP